MEDAVVKEGKNLVILEFGCGMNVPAVREESEEVLGDCIKRIEKSENKQGKATLVRVNPKDAGVDNNPDVEDCVVSIYDTSLKALQSLNHELEGLTTT